MTNASRTSYVVHYCCQGERQATGRASGNEAEALRRQLKGLLATLERRNHWKSWEAPRALVAHARLLCLALRQIAPGESVIELDAFEWRRRLRDIESTIDAA
jgi:hypothetical protein